MRATKVGLDSYATKLTSEAKTFSTTKSELMGSITGDCPHDHMGVDPLGSCSSSHGCGLRPRGRSPEHCCGNRHDGS